MRMTVIRIRLTWYFSGEISAMVVAAYRLLQAGNGLKGPVHTK
jgi:hypothetical protein